MASVGRADDAHLAATLLRDLAALLDAFASRQDAMVALALMHDISLVVPELTSERHNKITTDLRAFAEELARK